MSVNSQFLRDIRGGPDFRDNPKLALELVEKMRKGDKESKLGLVTLSLKYIEVLASAHCRRWNSWPNHADLIQEASRDISDKISDYDPARGSLEKFIRFHSLAAFIRYWRTLGTVHISESRRKLMARINQAGQKLAERLEREPTIEEISEYLNLDDEKVHTLESESNVSLISIDSSSEDETNSNVIKLHRLISSDRNPFDLAQLKEFQEIVIKAIGPINADLILGYEEFGTSYFQDLFFSIYGKRKSDDAVRQFVKRKKDEVRRFIEHRN